LNVGFAVVTAVVMNNSICRDMSSKLACYLLHAGFLLALFFDPEAGGDISLRNVGLLFADSE
jgi:hypothetical protein